MAVLSFNGIMKIFNGNPYMDISAARAAKLKPGWKKEILHYFSWLKSEEARERNLERALGVLSGEDGRFMARDWKEGK